MVTFYYPRYVWVLQSIRGTAVTPEEYMARLQVGVVAPEIWIFETVVKPSGLS